MRRKEKIITKKEIEKIGENKRHNEKSCQFYLVQGQEKWQGKENEKGGECSINIRGAMGTGRGVFHFYGNGNGGKKLRIDDHVAVIYNLKNQKSNARFNNRYLDYR